VFNNKIDIKDISMIETAVKGLLFIEPLKVVFDFQIVENIKDSALLPIIGIAKSIRDAAGSIEYISENELLLNRINQFEIK
jgi:hypothetical protein